VLERLPAEAEGQKRIKTLIGLKVGWPYEGAGRTDGAAKGEGKIFEKSGTPRIALSEVGRCEGRLVGKRGVIIGRLSTAYDPLKRGPYIFSQPSSLHKKFFQKRKAIGEGVLLSSRKQKRKNTNEVFTTATRSAAPVP